MFRLKNWQYICGAIGILFILTSLLADTQLYPYFYKAYTEGRARSVQHLLVEKQKEAENYLISVAKIPSFELPNAFNKLYDESNRNNILLYIRRLDGRYVFYTSNSVFPETVLISPADSELQHLANGYYFQVNIAAHGLIYIALIPVQYQYAIENQYLKNCIPFLKNNDDFDLTKNRSEGYPIYDSGNRYLFSLLPKMIIDPLSWIIILYISGLVLFFFFFGTLISRLVKKQERLWATVIFLSLNALFLVLWKVVRLPDALYRLSLFSSHYYGSSSFFSSLGDLLFF